jgi:hypothetical protein
LPLSAEKFQPCRLAKPKQSFSASPMTIVSGQESSAVTTDEGQSLKTRSTVTAPFGAGVLPGQVRGSAPASAGARARMQGSAARRNARVAGDMEASSGGVAMPVRAATRGGARPGANRRVRPPFRSGPSDRSRTRQRKAWERPVKPRGGTEAGRRWATRPSTSQRQEDPRGSVPPRGALARAPPGCATQRAGPVREAPGRAFRARCARQQARHRGPSPGRSARSGVRPRRCWPPASSSPGRPAPSPRSLRRAARDRDRTRRRSRRPSCCSG